MYCLRCGRECPDGQAFCADCLETSKAYPIKPGTAVQLPDRQKYLESRPYVRRRIVTAEEQVVQLRKSVRFLAIAVVILSLVLGITAALLLQSLQKPNDTMPGNLGRNYTSDVSDNK